VRSLLYNSLAVDVDVLDPLGVLAWLNGCAHDLKLVNVEDRDISVAAWRRP
jgi:hypothetical protein